MEIGTQRRLTTIVAADIAGFSRLVGFDEEGTLAETVKDIPRSIDGIDVVEILVIDAGSTDRTEQVAREAGVDHIIRFRRNRGLGYAFKAGCDACLKLGADIIVNTDGDNQYFGGDVPTIIKPVLAGRADLVVGDRQTGTIGHFSYLKRYLQNIGSRTISRMAVSYTHLPLPTRDLV